MIASFSGATDPPSPVISVVMPWKIFDGRCGATMIVNSDCPSMSMKPGATTRPWASIVRLADAPARRPIAAIRPSRMPTSAAYQGEPVPSITWPLTMTTSKGRPEGGGWRPAASSTAQRTIVLMRRSYACSVHHAALHDEAHPADGGDVVEQVAVGGDEVGGVADRDGAQAIAEAERRGRHRR